MKLPAAILILGATSFALEFTKIPTSQVVHFGEHATFEAIAIGKGLVKYSWYLDGVQVPNLSSGLFSTTPLTSQDNGSKVLCIVEDESGFSLSSEEVSIQVLPVSSNTILVEGDLELADGSNNFKTDLKVSLYGSPNGGQTLYSEEFTEAGRGGVVVKNGRFQVKLGGTDNGQLLQGVIQTNSSLYVEFQAGSSGSYETLLPRLPLTAFPYALTAPQTPNPGN